jgi:hypothetical protein
LVKIGHFYFGCTIDKKIIEFEGGDGTFIANLLKGKAVFCLNKE